MNAAPPFSFHWRKFRMEELASVINNFARLILYAGGGVFTITVCVAGFFYMTAFGDPQKQTSPVVPWWVRSWAFVSWAWLSSLPRS